jgi:hypothetical protein
MLVLLVCVVGTALLLQGLFEKSDHEKSERIVRAYRGDGGPTLGERVEAESPGGAWSSEIVDGCRGYVRVRYDSPRGGYQFDYEVPSHRIHPGNSAAERILGAIPAAPPDGGAPRSGRAPDGGS